MTPAPNSRSVAATTAGIARNMQLGLDPFGAVLFGPPNARETRDSLPAGQAAGGGDLNGSSATPYFGQSGTMGGRLQSPRTMAGNYCGIT